MECRRFLGTGCRNKNIESNTSTNTMTSKEKIKSEINMCLKETIPILEFLQGKTKDENYSFHIHYQKWYSKALKIIEFLASDRYAEFKSYYEIDTRRKSISYGTYVIQDFVKNVVPAGYDNFNTKQ